MRPENLVGREEDGEEMVGGVELDGLGVIGEVGGEVGGDGGEDLVQQAGVASPAGATGPAGP